MSAAVSGVLVVDKPAGMTSFGVVARVRKLYNTRRVGHTGTLDPDATGVLVVLVGSAASAAENLVSDEKEYDALMRLGVITDTQDTSGEVLSRSDAIPGADDVLRAAASFRGEILQTPPMYSALKVGGRKLVDIAREGGEVERRPRTVTISTLEASPTDDASLWRLRVVCSKGTYIRTLCDDIGRALGCGAAMESLRRLRAGAFSLADSVTLDALAEIDEAERISRLLPLDRVFAAYQAVRAEGRLLKLLKNGAAVPCAALKLKARDGEYFRLYDETALFALAEVKNGRIKPVKRFDT